jgi:excisionase family DNA binding protein
MISQVQKILNISRPTVQRRLKAGEIPFVRVGGRVLIPGDFFEELRDNAMGRTPGSKEE